MSSSESGKARKSKVSRKSRRASTTDSSMPRSSTDGSSGTRKKKSKSSSRSGRKNKDEYHGSYASSGHNQQDAQLEEINRPPVYKRIACVRYVRPMMPYNNNCWGWGPTYGGPSNCAPGYPYGFDPYGSGYPGDCYPSARTLIVPPRPKNLYRPATDADVIFNMKTVDECTSFLNILGACYKNSGEGPRHVIHHKPPPPPPPLPKPKVDRTKLLHKYFHDIKKKPKREEKKRSPPHKKKSPPPKKKSPPPKRKSPPPKEKKPPPPPPKVEKKPPPPPPPPPKVEKKPTLPPPPPPPPKVSSPPRPPPQSKKNSDSSKSSVNTVQNDFHFGERQEDGREHHYHADVVRRTSSFDAITNAATQIRSQGGSEAVAPQRHKDAQQKSGNK